MEKLKRYRKVFLWLVIGIASGACSHYLIELFYSDYNYKIVSDWIINSHLELFLLGTAILFIGYVFFSSLLGSSLIGGTSLIFLASALGIAANYKKSYRAEPLYPNELYMVRELPSLLQMIGVKQPLFLLTTVGLVTLVLFFFYRVLIKARQQKTPAKNKQIWRIIGAGTALILLGYVSRFNYPANKVRKAYETYAVWITFDQNQNYVANGFVAGFLSNLKAPPMAKPETYSEATIKRIHEKYAHQAEVINQKREKNDLKTNILLVMNESFSDPYALNGIESSKDPLAYYRTVTAQALSGKLFVSTFGGGTDTSEFEVLTGFLMEPFAPQMTSPFTQLTSQMARFPSLSAKFKRLDYKTTAIHPYLPSFYRRNDVYKNLGFDEFRHEKNMKHTEKVTEEHRYISDSAAYKEMFDVLTQSDTPDFIHLVTMQNHTSYQEKYNAVDFSTKGSGDPKEANAYFQDLFHSDLALKELIQQIDAFKEPVLLIFWGDHLPSFYAGEVLDLNPPEALYETPFFVYSNKKETVGEVAWISPAFLRNYVTEFLEVQVTPYEALLKELQLYLPVVDKRLYLETQNSTPLYSREELSAEGLAILEDYTLLLYDVTTGNQYADTFGFFE